MVHATDQNKVVAGILSSTVLLIAVLFLSLFTHVSGNTNPDYVLAYAS